MGYILMGIYLILTIAGLILYKYGSNKGALFEISNGALNIKLSLISIVGLICYLLSFLIYIVVIPRFNLTYLMPITSAISYIGIFVCSILFLKETITTYGLIGAITILVGVIIMNIKQ